MEPNRCGATNRQGKECGHPAGWGTDHPGFGRCKNHGGSSPNGRKHAATLREEYWQRIVEMADPALARLAQLVDGAETDSVRLAASRDILDRAGLGARHVHEHTGPGGGPIPVEVRAAELLERAKALRRDPAPKANSLAKRPVRKPKPTVKQAKLRQAKP